MKKSDAMRILAIGALIAFAAAAPAFCAESFVPAEAMKSADVENASFGYTPEGYITIMFGNRPATPQHSAGTVLADGSVAGGVFAGDYKSAGIAKLGFRIRSEFDVNIPVAAALVLRSADGRAWYNQKVKVSKVGGEWVANNIDFTTAAGWRRDGGGDQAAMWDADIQNVQSVGVRLSQRGLYAQHYSIDSFMLLDNSGRVVGESGLLPARVMDYFQAVYHVASVNDITDEMKDKDSDGDGMSDWAELMAGTDPEDQNSVFAAKIVKYEADGITLRWPCIADGVYDLMKKEGFGADFGVTGVGLYPNATDLANGFMEYKDVFEPERGPYLYKILKK